MKDSEFMIQQDFKEQQRRENYRRAEAFLYWKFGQHIHDLNRYLFGPREETLASFMVEFVEKVEEELMQRMRYIEELHLKDAQIRMATYPHPPIIMNREDIIHGTESKPTK